MESALEPLVGIDIPKIADFWNWVSKTFTPDYQREIENYLKQAVDFCDLEARMKVLRYRGLL